MFFLTSVLRLAIISCFTKGVPFVEKCRGGGMHHSLLSRETGTSLTFTCIKSECPAQARIGGGGVAGVSNDWCIKVLTVVV